MFGPFELVTALNRTFVELARHATIRQLTDRDRQTFARALDLLKEVARVYVDASADQRRRLRIAAGYYPEVRETWIDRIRRRMSWWPRKKGDYQDALWAAALGVAHQTAAGRVTRESLRIALGVLCVEGARYDARDTAVALRALRDAAQAAGFDPAPVFEEAAVRERASAIRGMPSMASLILSTLDAASRPANDIRPAEST